MILSEEKIIELVTRHCREGFMVARDFARSIESTVREEQDAEIARLNDLVGIWKDTSRQADKKINQLREANAELLEGLRQILDTDMVMREEDEGCGLEELNHARELIAKHGGK